MKYIEQDPLVEMKETLDQSLSLPISFISKYLELTEDEFKLQLKTALFPELEVMNSYDMLALGSSPFFIHFDDTKAIKLIRLAEEFSGYLPNSQQMSFAYLKDAAMYQIYDYMKATSSESIRVESWFKENYKSYIPQSSLIKFTNKNSQLRKLGGKRPDALVSIKSIIYPVECKLNFRNHNLKQLRGYMNLMNVNKGYAVAPKFSNTLERSDDIICITSP